MSKYESLEEEIAVAIADKMSGLELWECACNDNLKTLNDCTEDELLEYEREYLGEKHE